MPTIRKASDWVKKNETAVAVFTRGPHLSYDPISGNGESGNWVVNPEKLETVDRVIIYLRRNDVPENRILLGNYSGYRSSGSPCRYVIRFAGLKEVGVTGSNWIEFSQGGPNPVRFVVGARD